MIVASPGIGPALTNPSRSTPTEGLGVLRQVDEEEALPGRHRHRVERPVGLIEVLDVGRGGRPDEPAVERVGPGVVGALDRLGEAAGVLLAEPGASVAADVVIRPVSAGPVAQHDHALLPDHLQEIVARVGDAVLAPDADPPSEEDPFQLLGQDVR